MRISRPGDILPAMFPKLPIPGAFYRNGDGKSQPEAFTITDPAERFRMKLRRMGYDEELIEMGTKVMQNHLRTEEEAFEIGENYVKEMAK